MRANPGGSLLLLVLAGFAAQAQEAGNEQDQHRARATEIDGLQPSVSARDLSAGMAAIETRVSPQDLSADGTAVDRQPALADAGELPDAATVVAQDTRRRWSNNGVMDEIELGRTEITGNQELPKVLYIVPWQKSDPGNLTGKPINTLLDEVLAPIDRSEFIRQVEYYDDLYRKAEQ